MHRPVRNGTKEDVAIAVSSSVTRAYARLLMTAMVVVSIEIGLDERTSADQQSTRTVIRLIRSWPVCNRIEKKSLTFLSEERRVA